MMHGFAEKAPETVRGTERMMAPKYKSKQQWTPYDAMVDAGTIDPYEIGKDEINVVTNDQLEALSNQAKESMRV